MAIGSWGSHWRGSALLAAFAALAVAGPAQARDGLAIDCIASSGDRTLARDLVDDFLAENGIGIAPPPTDERLFAAADACFAANPVPEELRMAYFSGNLSHVMAVELRGRLVAARFDIALVDALFAEVARIPAAQASDIVESRIESFDDAVVAAAERSGMPVDLLGNLLGGYLGLYMQQRLAEEQLAGE